MAEHLFRWAAITSTAVIKDTAWALLLIFSLPYYRVPTTGRGSRLSSVFWHHLPTRLAKGLVIFLVQCGWMHFGQPMNSSHTWTTGLPAFALPKQFRGRNAF